MDGANNFLTMSRLKGVLLLLAVTSGLPLLVGTWYVCQTGKCSFSLNGGRKGWQLCCLMTASYDRAGGTLACLPKTLETDMGTCTLNIAHSGHSIPAAVCFHGWAMAPNVLLDIMGYCDTRSAEA